MIESLRRGRSRRSRLRRPGHGTLGFATPRHEQAPDEKRVRRNRVYFAVLPVALLAAWALWNHLRIEKPEAVDDKKPPEMREVEVAPPPPPPPEPEEPQEEPDPQQAPTNPTAQALAAAAPSVDLPQAGEARLDLALGTGAEGLAIAGAGGGGGGGGGGRFASETATPDRSPEVSDDGGAVEIPRKALDAGVSGKFEASFVVDAQGRVQSIEITGGPSGYGFEEAIRKALKRRRYKPGESGGAAVAVRVAVPFDFRVDP